MSLVFLNKNNLINVNTKTLQKIVKFKYIKIKNYDINNIILIIDFF